MSTARDGEPPSGHARSSKASGAARSERDGPRKEKTSTPTNSTEISGAPPIPSADWFHLPSCPCWIKVPNAVFDSGLLGALGGKRTALLVYFALRELAERRARLVPTSDTQPLVVGVNAEKLGYTFGMTSRSVRRWVGHLTQWGWLMRAGHELHLGERPPGKRARFYFDAWLATAGGRPKPTGSKKTMIERANRMTAALAAPTPDWAASAMAQRFHNARSPERYVPLNLSDSLLASEEGRGAVLLESCLRRLVYLPSFMTRRSGHLREVRVAQALLSTMLGGHEATVRRWIEVDCEHHRVAMRRRGFRERNIYVVCVPRTKDDPYAIARAVGAISRAAGSSEATLAILRRWRAARGR